MLKNKITDGKYIGQTTMTLKERMHYHLKDSADVKRTTRKISKAIKEYGINNFEITVLEKDIPINKLNEREEFWIRINNSGKPPNYNVKTISNRTRTNKKRVKEKINLTQDEITNIQYKILEIKNLDEVSKETGLDKSIISMINRGRLGKFNYDLDYPLIPTQKRQKLNWKLAVEIQNRLLKNEASLTELADEYNVSCTNIGNINKGLIYRDFKLSYPLSDVLQLSNYKITKEEYLFVVQCLTEGMVYSHISDSTHNEISSGSVSDIDKGKSYKLYSKDIINKFPIRTYKLKEKESRGKIQEKQAEYSLMESLNNSENN